MAHASLCDVIHGLAIMKGNKISALWMICYGSFGFG